MLGKSLPDAPACPWALDFFGLAATNSKAVKNHNQSTWEHVLLYYNHEHYSLLVHTFIDFLLLSFYKGAIRFSHCIWLGLAVGNALDRREREREEQEAVQCSPLLRSPHSNATIKCYNIHEQKVRYICVRVEVYIILSQWYPNKSTPTIKFQDCMLIPRPRQGWLYCFTGSTNGSTYHGLVIEGKPLHWSKSVCGTGDVLKHDKGLASHLERLQSHYIQNRSKLGENSVQRLLKFCTPKRPKKGVTNTSTNSFSSDHISIRTVLYALFFSFFLPSFFTFSLRLLMYKVWFGGYSIDILLCSSLALFYYVLPASTFFDVIARAQCCIKVSPVAPPP